MFLFVILIIPYIYCFLLFCGFISYAFILEVFLKANVIAKLYELFRVYFLFLIFSTIAAIAKRYAFFVIKMVFLFLG